jgi:hypothetical protein
MCNQDKLVGCNTHNNTLRNQRFLQSLKAQTHLAAMAVLAVMVAMAQAFYLISASPSDYLRAPFCFPPLSTWRLFL